MTKLTTLALLLGAIMPAVAQEAAKTPSFAKDVHEKNVAAIQTDAVKPRPEGSIYMGDFRAPKIENVRVAVIGLGERGTPQTLQLAAVPHCTIVGVCDLYDDFVQKTADKVEQRTGKRPATYSGDKDAYKKMLQELKPDAVFINTNWDTHAQFAIEVMEAGAHAFVEVPLATTIEDLWADREKNKAELDVLTAQRTKLQNRIRRAAPEEKELLRTEKAEGSAKIRDLRLRIQCADGIEERSIRMQENLDRMNDNERRAERQEITRNTIKNERGYDR